VFVDDTNGFDEMFEDLESEHDSQNKQKVAASPKSDGTTAFMSEMQGLDDKGGADAFMKAFAQLDRAAKRVHAKLHKAAKNAPSKKAHHPSLNPNAVNLEGGPYEVFEKNLGKPPSTPISDYTARLAAALATSAKTAAVTSHDFNKYKESPFALKVVGMDKKAKLAVTNPSKFKKMVDSIPKSKSGTGLRTWACSDTGRLMKKQYDQAMKFWNGPGHIVYGKLCSSTGGRCAAAKVLTLPYDFAGVAPEKIPTDVVTTWWNHKMDCAPTMKKVMKHSGATAGTTSLSLLAIAISMVLCKILA